MAGEADVMPETDYKKSAMGKTSLRVVSALQGWWIVTDQPRSRWISTSRKDENNVRIREMILEHRRRTIDELLDLSGVSWSSCQQILSEELQMKSCSKICAPRLNKSSPEWMLVVNWKNSWKLTLIFLRNHYWWRKSVLHLWHGDEAAAKLMEVLNFTTC
jgi:hypothetical protein